jgi:hypothetical protein
MKQGRLSWSPLSFYRITVAMSACAASACTASHDDFNDPCKSIGDDGTWRLRRALSGPWPVHLLGIAGTHRPAICPAEPPAKLLPLVLFLGKSPQAGIDSFLLSKSTLTENAG